MTKLNWDKTPNDKLSELGLSPDAYVVLVWLIKYQSHACGVGSDMFYLNQSALAKKLNICKRSMVYIMKSFKEKGYITCFPQEPKEGKKHSGRVNRYKVVEWLMDLK